MAHKVVTSSGGSDPTGSSTPGGHKVVHGNTGGLVLGPAPIRVKVPAPGTLPDWWAVLNAGTSGSAAQDSGGQPLLPLSNAIAPGTLLPVCYGSVRIGGSALVFGPVGGSMDGIDGWGLIALCEGEIEAVDKFYGNGAVWSAYPAGYVSDSVRETFWTHLGANGDSRFNGIGDMLGGVDVSAFTNVACIKFRLTTYTTTAGNTLWWSCIPNGKATADAGTPNEWAADVRGLKVYDPRTGLTVYSTNPALIVRDMLKRYGALIDAQLDDTSFANAANACDSAGFTCSIAFATQTKLTDAIAQVLQTCNGTLITTNAGLTGIFLDQPNADPPVATFDEDDGDIYKLSYQWISARDRYTRVAVSFNDSASNYASTTTPNFDDPGIALGTVPIKAQVVTAPGINTMAAALVLRDYLFNVQAITFRISGTMNAKAISLQQGQKVHLTTQKGVDADFLLTQINADQDGFFAFVAQPYDAGVYASVPVVIPPTIIGTPVVNPTDQPQDIVVTSSSGERKGPPASSSNTTVYDIYQLIQYQMPASAANIAALRVRGFAGTGAGSKTWEDMAGSEIVVPYSGNEPPPDASHSMLSHPGVVKTVETLTFAVDGQLIQTVDAVGPTRIMIKTITAAQVLSAGVTVDVAQSTNTTTNTRSDIPLLTQAMIAADGTTKTFAVPDKWCPGTLKVWADGEFLVEVMPGPVTPASGADFSVSGQNVVIATARAAPLNYVFFEYQKSVVP